MDLLDNFYLQKHRYQANAKTLDIPNSQKNHHKMANQLGYLNQKLTLEKIEVFVNYTSRDLQIPELPKFDKLISKQILIYSSELLFDVRYISTFLPKLIIRLSSDEGR